MLYNSLNAASLIKGEEMLPLKLSCRNMLTGVFVDVPM